MLSTSEKKQHGNKFSVLKISNARRGIKWKFKTHNLEQKIGRSQIFFINPWGLFSNIFSDTHHI